MFHIKSGAGRLLLAVVGLCCLLLAGLCGNAHSGEPQAEQVMTMTVLPFKVRSKDADKDVGVMLGQLLLAELSTKFDPERIVDREDLQTVLGELELSESGLVAPDQMLRIGQLSGAKLLVTGSLFKMGDKVIVAAKVISSETSKTIGVAYKDTGDFDQVVTPLAKQIADVINEKGQSLLPPKPDPSTAALRVKEFFAKNNISTKHKVYVRIPEEITNTAAPDPAAQTGLQQMLVEAGFELTENRDEAELVFTGEGLAEMSGNHKNFFSATARVELKLYRKGKLLGAVAQREVMAATSMTIACKAALQALGVKLGEKLLLSNVKEIGMGK